MNGKIKKCAWYEQSMFRLLNEEPTVFWLCGGSPLADAAWLASGSDELFDVVDAVVHHDNRVYRHPVHSRIPKQIAEACRRGRWTPRRDYSIQDADVFWEWCLCSPDERGSRYWDDYEWKEGFPEPLELYTFDHELLKWTPSWSWEPMK